MSSIHKCSLKTSRKTINRWVHSDGVTKVTGLQTLCRRCRTLQSIRENLILTHSPRSLWSPNTRAYTGLSFSISISSRRQVRWHKSQTLSVITPWLVWEVAINQQSSQWAPKMWQLAWELNRVTFATHQGRNESRVPILIASKGASKHTID